MIKIRDLAARAGRFLGLAPAARAPQAGVVESDRFDHMTWRDTQGQASALRELIGDLAETHDYAGELVRDMFMAAYKAEPCVRAAGEIDPSRMVNRQVVSSLLETPEWEELRRETVGEPYASAMAVLAQAGAVRRILEQAEQARRAADGAAGAQREAEDAAQDVADAMAAAGDQAGEDGSVPDETAEAAQQAIARAEDAAQAAESAAQKAAQALAAAAPGMRATARAAASEAAEAAREEAALMAAWGVGPGELQRMDFDTRAQLAQRLRAGRLAKFTQLIGRFRQMAAAQRAHRIANVPGEVVGIELGGDIARLIPAELAALAVPGMREDFIARLTEGRAMVYAQRGETQAGQGAIICCVDCSYSMSHPVAGTALTAEAWAKAFALSLLDQARTEHRDFAGILFSSEDEVKVFRFPASHPVRITDVIEFAEHFFGGGTDFEAPLSTAVDILTGQFDAVGLKDGDIAFVTDGICDVSEEWMRGYQETKSRIGFRTFGIRIGVPAGSILDALSDNVRAIEDLADLDTAADIFRAV